MGVCHYFQTALTFANLIPFIQIRVCKSETIIQNPCYEALDEDNVVQNLWASRIMYYSLYILWSNVSLHLPN